MNDEPWIVGRDDGHAVYVERCKPTNGEEEFPTEVEAVRYAIQCQEDLVKPIRVNLRTLRARLRRIEPRQS